MAAGDMAGKVLRATAGVMSSIDRKATRKALTNAGTNHTKMMATSGAYKAGRATTNFLTGGIRGTASSMKKGDDVFTALAKGHSVPKKVDGQTVRGLSAKKVAGSVVGVGVAGRAVTGGGLYRDRYGNVNVPGVPFI